MIDEVIAGSNVEPRTYQRSVTTKSVDMFNGRYKNGTGQVENAARSVMIESPTGSGKTVMGHMVVKAQQMTHDDLVIGWIAMRRNLLTQAEREHKQMGFNIDNIHYTSMFDDRPEHLIKAKEAGKRIMMVVDEAQHDSATSMAHLHNLLEPDWILGLTATPFRTDNVKLCFDKVVKDAGIHQLIQDGYLSQFEHFSIPRWSVDDVVDFYSREPERWGKSIFYFLTTGECLEFERKILDRSNDIMGRLKQHRPDLSLEEGLIQYVKGGQHKVTERQLTDFRAGKIGILVNCMVLTEGFDDPTLETAWVRDSGKGPTMQMAGRAFRTHPEWKNNQNESFRCKKIVQSKDTRHPILKTAMADQQFLWQSGDWKSLKINPFIKEISSTSQRAVARMNVELPEYLVNRRSKKVASF